MPNAMTVQAVNTALTTDGVVSLSSDGGVLEQLARPGSLLEVAQTLLDLGAEELEYLRAIPTVLQEALRAAINQAVAAGKPVQLQYSPGYEFEVRMWDYGQAVSIHLSGPYTADAERDRTVPLPLP